MKNLERRLDLGAVVAICLSAMLGVSIFVMPGVAIAKTGPSVWLAYLIAAVAGLPASLAKAELATAMPTSGGTYIYVERTFGPLAGLIAGLGLWLSLLLKTAFALVGIGSYVDVLTDVPLQTISLSLLVFIIALNLLGVGKISSALIYVVVAIIGTLAFLSAAGGLHYDPALTEPSLTFGLNGLLAASSLVFISYAGITKVAAIAEEVKRPERNLPLGIVISLVIITIVYCGVSYVLVGTVPSAELAGDLKPLYTEAVHIGGKEFGIFIAVVAVLAMTSMANAGVLAASRFPFAMSRDRLLPSVLGSINRRFMTPVYSIIASGAVLAFAIIFLDVERIAKLASVFLLLIYISENMAVIIMREARVHWYRPTYRSPWYPYLQIVGILAGSGLVLSMIDILPGALAMVAVPGALIYFLYSRTRVTRRGVIGMRGVRRDLIETQTAPFHQGWATPLDEAKVVVSLYGRERSPELLVEMGVALAEGGQVEVAHLTEIPEQTNVHDVTNEDSGVRSLRRRVQAMSTKLNIPITFDTLHSHDVFKSIYEITSQLHCAWLVQEWGGRTRGAFTLYRQMGSLEAHLQCHVLTVRDKGVRYTREILVLIDLAEHDDFVVETATKLAVNHQANVTLATLPRGEDEALAKAALERIASERPHFARTVVLQGKDEVQAALNATAEYDLLIMQASRKPSLMDRLFGARQDRIIAKSACSVVMVRPFRGLSANDQNLTASEALQCRPGKG